MIASERSQKGRAFVSLSALVLCLTLASTGWAQSAVTETDGRFPAAPPQETIIFPLSQVHRGLRGVAYTVFEGVAPEPMEVEILGLLKNSRGPGQDMILARLHGKKPEYTGVVAGMSGSPVYIDGKLLGALSFRIGQFSKEPIAGITPIEQMLQVSDDNPVHASGFDQSAVTAAGEMQPIETPLVFGGFSQESVDRFGDRFRAIGLTPVAELGGSDADTSQPEPIVPGSAVSAIIVGGDLSMSGTCTVTYVDRTHLLACGHPITQFGHVEMPMTKATVLATLPSPLNAFKIINTTETVGAFTEDRNSAISGVFGKVARMIPVTVAVTPEGSSAPKTLHFYVVDNKELTPSAMLVSVYQSLQQTNLAAAEASYRISGELTVKGQPPVKLAGIMAPNELNPAAINTALYINELFGRIYGNAATQPVVTGLQVDAQALGATRSAVLDQLRLSKSDVSGGETIEVEATIRPFRLPAKTIRIPVTIPANLERGDLRLVVSDGATADHMLLPSPSVQPVSLNDVVGQINRAHANDRLYVTLLVHDAQTVLEGGTMGGVPLSLVNVLDTAKNEHGVLLSGETAIALGSAETDFATTGSQVVELHIK